MAVTKQNFFIISYNHTDISRGEDRLRKLATYIAALHIKHHNCIVTTEIHKSSKRHIVPAYVCMNCD